jgi:hypothetical protein
MWSWRHIALGTVAFIAVLAAPGLVEAQTGTISGTVVDSATRRPIEGVRVVVQGTSYGNVTRADGRYAILSVPPGVYTLEARIAGYTQVNRTNVDVRIDVNRVIDFQLTQSVQQLGVVQIEAPPVPLVEQGVVGAVASITSEMISALPVTSISEVLALQQGYQELPQNTNLVSLAEERRNTTASASVRGSRGGSSVNLVDGVPVNNPVFGSAAIQINTSAVSQVDFSPGYMEPQYGNGMGLSNSAVREGGERFQGGLDYSTSAIPGLLGSKAAEVQNQHLFRGYISGPIPIWGNRLRYSLSGQVLSEKQRVLEFDDNVAQFNVPTDTNEFGQTPQTVDLERGWRGFGGNQNQQVVGKLTYQMSPTVKFSFTMADQARQRQTYDRRYLLAYTGEPWDHVNNLMDSLGVSGSRNLQHIVQGSTRDESYFYAFKGEKRFQRSNISASVGQNGLLRNTCNLWQGVCSEARYWEGNFSENFHSTFTPVGVPYHGTDLYYGGEDYYTQYVRADYVTQATDHHRVQVGASYTIHNILYDEVVGIDGNSGPASSVLSLYRAEPIEVSTYLQDVVEYDFLSIRFGVRYDYGLAQGKGFTNPLNSTNGTTAREVCNGAAPGINTTPFTYTGADGIPLSGVLACLGSEPNAAGKAVLLDSATKLAQVDDFKDADARTSFSPRIGLAFPLTERSQLFFNAGRYTRNPSYHDVYRNSGVGTIAGPLSEGGDGFCDETAIKPGTNECHPPLVFNNPEFIGNPNLLAEQTTSYEVGYTGQIGNNYAIDVTVYNSDQSGLTGIRVNDAIQDLGATYNGISLPQYRTTVNQDFLTSRGMTVAFRRRLINRWSYNINYGWGRTTENSPPPDRSFEAAESNELNRGNTLREQISGRDQGHTFNMSLSFAFRRNDVPTFPGATALLKDSNIGLTYRWQSGRPYTPNRDFALSGTVNTNPASDQNSGRGPSTQTANLSYNKSLAFGNARYGISVRVTNIFNIRNCEQVFQNTGNCDTGIRDFSQRRVGNQGTDDAGSSTNVDNPQNRGAGRAFFTGFTVNF